MRQKHCSMYRRLFLLAGCLTITAFFFPSGEAGSTVKAEEEQQEATTADEVSEETLETAAADETEDDWIWMEGEPGSTYMLPLGQMAFKMPGEFGFWVYEGESIFAASGMIDDLTLFFFGVPEKNYCENEEDAITGSLDELSEEEQQRFLEKITAQPESIGGEILPLGDYTFVSDAAYSEENQFLMQSLITVVDGVRYTIAGATENRGMDEQDLQILLAFASLLEEV